MIKHNFTGSPEHYMETCQIKDYGDIDIDALSVALDRAEALSIILSSQFDGSMSDKFNSRILLSAIDALGASIGQAQILIHGSEKFQ